MPPCCDRVACGRGRSCSRRARSFLAPRPAGGVLLRGALEERQPLELVTVAFPKELRVLPDTPDRHPGRSELRDHDDPLDVLGGESPVPRIGPLDRREQARALVVADRVRAHSRALRRLGDRQVGGVNVAIRLSVEVREHSKSRRPRAVASALDLRALEPLPWPGNTNGAKGATWSSVS